MQAIVKRIYLTSLKCLMKNYEIVKLDINCAGVEQGENSLSSFPLFFIKKILSAK